MIDYSYVLVYISKPFFFFGISLWNEVTEQCDMNLISVFCFLKSFYFYFPSSKYNSYLLLFPFSSISCQWSGTWWFYLMWFYLFVILYSTLYWSLLNIDKPAFMQQVLREHSTKMLQRLGLALGIVRSFWDVFLVSVLPKVPNQLGLGLILLKM